MCVIYLSSHHIVQQRLSPSMGSHLVDASLNVHADCRMISKLYQHTESDTLLHARTWLHIHTSRLQYLMIANSLSVAGPLMMASMMLDAFSTRSVTITAYSADTSTCMSTNHTACSQQGMVASSITSTPARLPAA